MLVLALGAALAACADGDPLVTPDLQLACQPASGTIHVGDSIVVVASYEGAVPLEEPLPPLDWVEQSEGGGVTFEAAPPPWEDDGAPFSLWFERTVHATATRPGRTTIMTRWTAEGVPPIFRQDRNTRCTYDVIEDEPPPAGLTVGVRRAGSVTSTPAGIACNHPSFDTTVVECSAPLRGMVSLRGAPDPEFGFRATAWTGCDAVDGNVCLVTVASARRVDACFHDGTPAGLAACQ